MLNIANRNKIETDRLILRHYQKNDLKDIFKNYASDKDVARYFCWDHPYRNLQETKKAVERWEKVGGVIKKYRYYIEIKKTHEVIGFCSIVPRDNGVPDLGYAIGRKWWNQGIMSEACKAFIATLFLDGYDKIAVKAEFFNIASLKVIKKCGFKFIEQKALFYPKLNRCIIFNYYELNKIKK